MHLDRLGNDTQRQRLEVFDPGLEERLLLFDEFGRDLDDRPRALIEGTDQPCRVGQRVRQEGARGLCRCRAPGGRGGSERRVIAAVDQHAGKRRGVQLDGPPPAARAVDEDIGDDRLRVAAAIAQTGLGVIGAQLADHVGQVVLIDPAQSPQGRHIAPGEKIEAGEQCQHRGIGAVGLARLRRQAFAQAARATADGVEVLDNPKDGLDPLGRGVEAFGEVGDDIGTKIAGVVDLIDQEAGNPVVDRIVESRRRLLVEDVAQRRRRSREAIEVEALAGFAAAADRTGTVEAAAFSGPVIANRVGRAVVVEGFRPIVDVERRVGRGLAARDQLVGRGFALRGRLLGGSGREVVATAVEKGVLLDLGVDERFKLDIGQRQQLDRLLELDGHHQRLRLAEVEARTEAHACKVPVSPHSPLRGDGGSRPLTARNPRPDKLAGRSHRRPAPRVSPRTAHYHRR